MPLRDLACDKCDQVFADVLTGVHEVMTCPDCGDDLRRLFTPAAMIGPTERKPEVYNSCGIAFTSNKARRDYFERNPYEQPVSKQDPEFRRMYTKVRDANELQSKALGYRDWEHRQHATPAEKAERKAAIAKSPTTEV